MDENACKRIFLIFFVAVLLCECNATIFVISKTSNETVFSAEEIGIDAASAYDLRGSLIIAEPPDACSEVKPPPPRNHTIVISPIPGRDRVQRRDAWILWATYNYSNDPCSLSRKAKEAEFAGYSAIIITVYGTNDTAGILPNFMGFDWMGVKIYTSILGENMGTALKRYAYPKRYIIEFENEPYFQLGLLANFIFLGCLGIIIVVILLRLFHCIYMRVSRTVHERRRKRKAFLTESQLKKLPVLHFRSSIPQDTCSICIENFEVGEEIRVLPCSHVFHKPCIDPWLIHSSRRCPNCKGKVIFPNEHLSDSSNTDSDSPLDDSDDEFLGNERTPLLRSTGTEDSEDMIEDTRFVEAVAESHTSSSHEPPSKAKVETACLIDIGSDTEQLPLDPDETFGTFQKATDSNPSESAPRKSSSELVDIESDGSVSIKSFDSDKTFVQGQGEEAVGRRRKSGGAVDELTSSFSSNASFFSCLESELERSSSTNNTSGKQDVYHSFTSSSS